MELKLPYLSDRGMSRSTFMVLFVLMFSARAIADLVYPSATDGQQADEDIFIISRLNAAAGVLKEQGPVAAVEYANQSSDANLQENRLFIIDYQRGDFLYTPEMSDEQLIIEPKGVNPKPFAHHIKSHYEKVPSVFWDEVMLLIDPYSQRRYYVRIVESMTNGKLYLLCSARSNLLMESIFVNRLVALASYEFEQFGPAAFRAFDNPEGIFRSNDTYVFVLDDNGTLIFNPDYDELVGKDLKDTKLRELFAKEVKVAFSKKGSGWVAGEWYKPDAEDKDKLFPKLYFVEGVECNGKKYVVGSGVYVSSYVKRDRLYEVLRLLYEYNMETQLVK